MPLPENNHIPASPLKLNEEYPHYYKNVSRLAVLDVYRVLDLFEVTNPCVAHAVKKLLVIGDRGSKDFDTDLKEAIDTLKRLQDMRKGI